MRTPGHFCDRNFPRLNYKARSDVLIGAFVNNRDLIDGNIRNLFIFVSQIEDPGLNIDHVSAKGSVGAACYVDLFTQKLF